MKSRYRFGRGSNKSVEGAQALGAFATGALAAGGFALGAVAIGAIAVGALAIGRVSVGRGRIGRLTIDELTVRRLVIVEELSTPPRVSDGSSNALEPERVFFAPRAASMNRCFAGCLRRSKGSDIRLASFSGDEPGN